MSNQTQVDAPSPPATPSLPRPIATVNPYAQMTSLLVIEIGVIYKPFSFATSV